MTCGQGKCGYPFRFVYNLGFWFWCLFDSVFGILSDWLLSILISKRLYGAKGTHTASMFKDTSCRGFLNGVDPLYNEVGFRRMVEASEEYARNVCWHSSIQLLRT